MNIIKSTVALSIAFCLIFGGQVEAKQHSSKKTRDRILKEISKNNSYKNSRSVNYKMN